MRAKSKMVIRPAADKTRSAILQAAIRLFAKNGFAGTSISDIAEQAKINQSLIYHHFGNKEKLWQKTKLEVMQNYFVGEKNFPESANNLKDFLQKNIKSRFEFFKFNPNALRIARWQRLENISAKPFAASRKFLENWQKILQELEQSGELRPGIDCNYLNLIINNLIFAAFDATNPALRTDQEAYLATVIDILYRGLRSNN